MPPAMIQNLPTVLMVARELKEPLQMFVRGLFARDEATIKEAQIRGAMAVKLIEMRERRGK